MKHYDITILGAGEASSILASKLQNNYKVLLVDKRPLDKECYSKYIDKIFSTYYRNTIKSEKGYIVILNKERKNLQISTDIIIRADEESLVTF